MTNSKLPERASLEYLRKLAKDRLRELRRADPKAKLATALLSVARDYGFHMLAPEAKAEVEKVTRGYADKTEYFVDKLSQGIGVIAAAFHPKPVILRLSVAKSASPISDASSSL